MNNQIVVDWAQFHLAELALGQKMRSVLSWFDEDGGSASQAIIDAVKVQDAMTIILTAGLLKVDAMQIGALSVSQTSEACELAARCCIDDGAPWHDVRVQAEALAFAHSETVQKLWAEIERIALTSTELLTGQTRNMQHVG